MGAWTLAKMRALATDERASLGLDDFGPLDPRLLAEEYGVPVYRLTELVAEAPAAVAHYAGLGSDRWSAALVPIGSARVIVENDTHAEVRRRSSIAHELGHHLLEHPLETIMLGDGGCRSIDRAKEKQATYLSGQLLVPERAAMRAAFDERTNEQVAAVFEVSIPFAQMRLSGPRVIAERAKKKRSRLGLAARFDDTLVGRNSSHR